MPILDRTQLEALTASYNAIKENGERQVFYAQKLYPALRDYFAAQPGADPPIEVLLLPVSNQHTPVLAAARWKPSIVVAIYSSQSAKHRQFIKDEIAQLELNILYKEQEVLNIEIEPDRLYSAIKHQIKPYLQSERSNPHIAVDITGGTKVMSVGAAMAVSLIGGRFFYILTSTTRDDIQQRQVGSEQPCTLVDPYLVFGDLDRRRAQELYQQHDYLGAARIYLELAQRVHPSHGDLQWAILSEAYAAWDVFDLKQAAERMNSFILLLDREDTDVVLRNAKPLLIQQARLLDELARIATSIEKSPPLTLLQQLDPVLAVLGSLYQNALRREQQGRYDIAALLLYRCLELMSQRRLALLGIDTAPAKGKSSIGVSQG
jgi:CRISPR-associated protein (TIGR02710 family)